MGYRFRRTGTGRTRCGRARSSLRSPVAAMASPPWLWAGERHRRRGAKLPGARGPDHRAGDARIERRHFGPRAGRRHVGAIRQAGHRRQQAGRQWRARHRRCRPRQSRRLHADARRDLFDHRAAAHRQGCRLYGEIVHADLPDLQERPGHRGAAEFAAEDREGHRRGGEAEARRAQCRHSRHRHHPAPRHDPIGAAGQGRVQRRAVQGAGRGNPEHPLRPARFRRRAVDRRGRQRAGDAGTIRGDAQSVAARRADIQGAGL